MGKMFLALSYILMVFLLYDVVNPRFRSNVPVFSRVMENVVSPSGEGEANASYVFNIPKKLWIAEAADTSYLSGLIASNNYRVAQESGFESSLVNRDNFRHFLSEVAVETVEP
jgi:hypothetical protein